MDKSPLKSRADEQQVETHAFQHEPVVVMRIGLHYENRPFVWGLYGGST
jgi:hypothetical protein